MVLILTAMFPGMLCLIVGMIFFYLIIFPFLYSFSVSAPLYLWVYFYVCDCFSIPSFCHFFISRSPHKLQQPQAVFYGAHFCSLKPVSFSRVLVHCHQSSPATGAYSFSKSEMGFYLCAVLCVHRHRTCCF